MLEFESEDTTPFPHKEILNLCLIGVHPWLEEAEMISSG